MNITMIGAGAWGSALARLLHENGHAVTLWAHDSRRLDEIRRTGRNERYLPGIDLPRELRLEPDLPGAVAGADVAVIAVPSSAFRPVTASLADFGGIAVSVTKGIEDETGLTMSGILKSTVPRAKTAALSGPTLALEVVRNVPGAIVAASEICETAQRIQEVFHRRTFRVYTSTDLIGVELGGALKNVIAIAAGACDGIGFGDNSKAALVTRGLSEMRRLGVACGAQPNTFFGLSGLGDLAVTCFSKLSRNHLFGERLGRGEMAAEIVARSITVAEGYPTARSAFHLARKLEVETPIIDEVYAVLYEEKPAAAAVRDLLERDSKAED
jgi:glycerol-3-phosphate dehydrogenase (NAD(P)+)